MKIFHISDVLDSFVETVKNDVEELMCSYAYEYSSTSRELGDLYCPTLREDEDE